MQIELVSKKVEWVPGEGVHTHIKVQASIPHFSGMGSMMAMNYKHEIHIAGTDKPIVSLDIGTSTGIKGGRDAWVAALHDWLATSNYIEEWEGEAVKYRHVVSQVDLPTHPIIIGREYASTDCHALTYELMVGEKDFYISVEVVAKYEGAIANLAIVEPDNYYEEYGTSSIRVGEIPLTYPITVHSVKAAIGPAVDAFLSKVGELAGEPVVGMPPPEYFYDR